MKVLANAIVVILLEYMGLSNLQVVYLKLIQWYMSIISQYIHTKNKQTKTIYLEYLSKLSTFG